MLSSSSETGSRSVRWRRALIVALGALLAAGCERSPRFDRPVPEYRAEALNADLVDGLVMPRTGTLLVWGSDGTVLRSEDGLRWQHAHTPTAADLAQGATDGDVAVVVGDRGSILRSDDDGLSWSAAGAVPREIKLQAVTYDVKRQVWIAAGTEGVLAHSRDGGSRWSVQRLGKPVKLESLFYDADKETVWLGSEDGLLGHSSDGGETWTLLQSPLAAAVAGFHRFGDTLIARSGLGRLMVSHDDGRSWQPHQLATKAFFTAGAFDPVTRSIVLTSQQGEVARSTDGGRNWSLIQTVFDARNNPLSAVRFEEKSRSLIAVGHHGTMLRSTDGGLGWEEALPAGIPVSFAGLIYDARRGTMCVPGNGGYLLGSRDAGEVWQTGAVGLPEYQREVAVSADGQAIVTVGDVGSIYRGTAEAQDWRTPEVEYPDPAIPPAYRALSHAPDGQALLAAGSPGTIARSTDAGESWTATLSAPPEKGGAIVQFVVDAKRKLVVALDAFGAMKRSVDGGLSWENEHVDLAGSEVRHGALTPGGAVLAVGKGGLIVRSAADGKDWRVVSRQISKQVDLYGSFCVTNGKACFALGQQGCILRSENEGQNWETVRQGGEFALWSMAEDPRSGALIAFGEHGLILRSTDTGRTWTAVPSGVEAELRAAAIEPGSGQIVLVGASGTLLRSGDGGQNWQILSSHTERHLRGLAFNPINGVLVLVGERMIRLSPNTPVKPREP